MLRERLEQIDVLLREGGVESDFVSRALEGWNPGGQGGVSAGEQIRYQQRSRRALRCTILRTLLQEDYRGFSCQLAGNPLYQWFCGVDALEAVRVPSKSELQRFAHWLPAEAMRGVLDGLLHQAEAVFRQRRFFLLGPLVAVAEGVFLLSLLAPLGQGVPVGCDLGF